jgi:hypothetical protein
LVPAYADAEGFKRYVTRALGVREGNIVDLRDATQADLISVFGGRGQFKGRLFNWVKPGRSNVTIYYSGHGAPAGGDGTPYLVPVNANPATIELNGYPLEVLYANLGKVPAKSIRVVLETCFSGAAEGGAIRARRWEITVNPLDGQRPPLAAVTDSGFRMVGRLGKVALSGLPRKSCKESQRLFFRETKAAILPSRPTETKSHPNRRRSRFALLATAGETGTTSDAADWDGGLNV